MGSVDSQPPPVLDRLLAAINAHELEAMVSCFAEDYTNETPVHPPRGFRGQEQVRTNWSQIFAAVPNIHARVVRSSVDGDTLWTEWDIAGDRADGARFLMRGVVIFGVAGDTIASARFYLEPVEDTSGDVNAHTRRVTGTTDQDNEGGSS
ncbi:MAG: nuclear transport factor 2 family protein [Actinomycetota bacterium]|nr:nuclear transport factor 2 family protein [Actinomycetota bacterium]MDQ3783697.1 nuclear transport factor 2 family protein [Actinomycetota bacterium]